MEDPRRKKHPNGPANTNYQEDIQKLKNLEYKSNKLKNEK
jgi:hypothetical protein